MLVLKIYEHAKVGHDHAILIETSDGPISVRLIDTGTSGVKLGISAPDLCRIRRESHDPQRILDAEGKVFEPRRKVA